MNTKAASPESPKIVLAEDGVVTFTFATGEVLNAQADEDGDIGWSTQWSSDYLNGLTDEQIAGLDLDAFEEIAVNAWQEHWVSLAKLDIAVFGAAVDRNSDAVRKQGKNDGYGDASEQGIESLADGIAAWNQATGVLEQSASTIIGSVAKAAQFSPSARATAALIAEFLSEQVPAIFAPYEEGYDAGCAATSA